LKHCLRSAFNPQAWINSLANVVRHCSPSKICSLPSSCCTSQS
jgi:hypothetical protein